MLSLISLSHTSLSYLLYRKFYECRNKVTQQMELKWTHSLIPGIFRGSCHVSQWNPLEQDIYNQSQNFQTGINLKFLKIHQKKSK